MNQTSRFLIKGVSVMALLGLASGEFVPTASACLGDACRKYVITGSGSQPTIQNTDRDTKVSITGCIMTDKDGLVDNPNPSKCVSGSKFEKIIDANHGWSGPAVAQGKEIVVLTARYYYPPAAAVVNGCTQEQRTSARGAACARLSNQLTSKDQQYDYVLRCTGEKIECCVKSWSGTFGQCDASVVYPKTPNPPNPAVVCENLKTDKGVWTPDPKSIKQNSDKKRCTKTFTCAAPSPQNLSADQRKCTPVVSVSNKTVTKDGLCAGDKCDLCDVANPNDPCVISFRKP